MPILTASQRAFLAALLAAVAAPVLGARLFGPIAPDGPSFTATILALLVCGAALWLVRRPER